MRVSIITVSVLFCFVSLFPSNSGVCDESISELIQRLKQGRPRSRELAAIEICTNTPKIGVRCVEFLVEVIDKGHEKDQATKVAMELVLVMGRSLRGSEDARKATQEWVSALQDSRPDIKRKAVRMITWLGDRDAVEPLFVALKEKYAGVRREAAKGLGLIGDSRAVEPLMAALKDTSITVRTEAAMALGKIKDMRAVPALIECLGTTGVFLTDSTGLFVWGGRQGAENDRAKLHLATLEALRSITGQQFKHEDDWKKWWEQNKK